MPRNGCRNGNGRRRRRNTPRTRNNAQGPSLTPANILRRKFRYDQVFTLGNTTGSGDFQYCYYGKYIDLNPEAAEGFRDAKRTFELWRQVRARVWIQPGYNPYNATYNTINLDSAIATTVWTVADLGRNETVSGPQIMSYDNARFHTLSLNRYVPIINTACRLNTDNKPTVILPGSTWLDTQEDTEKSQYNGFQLFAKMPQVNATNWRPNFQLIIEIECEFKQPAWQNISTSFESSGLGSILECQINDNEERTYVLDKYMRTIADGVQLHFVRQDGEPGSLTYSVEDFYEVYKTGFNVGYFGNRAVKYTGPIPPRM